MKQFIYSPIDESFFVSYLTNAVGTNDRLFINEIKHSTDGENWLPGLGASGAEVNLFGDYKETTLTLMKAKAVALNMNLRVYEDRQAEVNINESLAFFLSFTVQTNPESVIDNDAETIDIELPFGSVVTALTPKFTTTNGATVEVDGDEIESGQEEIDCTNPVDFDVISADGSVTKTYTLTVTVAAE